MEVRILLLMYHLLTVARLLRDSDQVHYCLNMYVKNLAADYLSD